ncbi:MAG: hypothetical protein RL189_1226 [Pseudomonadota bacterium]
MFCPDSTPAPPAVECAFYRPGDWRQDMYTIPLEALSVAVVSSIKPPAEPRWPFSSEKTDKERQPSRHPGFFAAGLGLGVSLPLTAALVTDNPDFPVLTHVRGLIHTHLWTEFFASSAKNYFGRHRPFYNTELRNSTDRIDDRRSFFSGHSAHSFAFAGYLSQVALSEMKDSTQAWFFVSLLNGVAVWVGSSRAVDHQHNWSDVLTGTVVGGGMGYLMYHQVARSRGLTVQFSPDGKKITLSAAL